MNIENILKYQDLDKELFKVEQKISNSPYKKKATELSTIAKKSQTKSTELESEAAKLVNEINDLKEKFAFNKSKLDEILKNDVEKMSLEDVEKMSNLKSKIAQNLNVLEKMLQKSAENINKILSEFNRTIKTFNDAKTQYGICKQKIDEESKALEPERNKLSEQLKDLEKGVDKELLTEYKKKRLDERIFPVIVPLESGTFCGYCRMEQPKVALSRLKENGIITCEHCKRFIYLKK